MHFGAIANSARGGPLRPLPPVRDRVNNYISYFILAYFLVKLHETITIHKLHNSV